MSMATATAVSGSFLCPNLFLGPVEVARCFFAIKEVKMSCLSAYWLRQGFVLPNYVITYKQAKTSTVLLLLVSTAVSHAAM